MFCEYGPWGHVYKPLRVTVLSQVCQHSKNDVILFLFLDLRIRMANTVSAPTFFKRAQRSPNLVKSNKMTAERRRHTSQRRCTGGVNKTILDCWDLNVFVLYVNDNVITSSTQQVNALTAEMNVFFGWRIGAAMHRWWHCKQGLTYCGTKPTGAKCDVFFYVFIFLWAYTSLKSLKCKKTEKTDQCCQLLSIESS